MGRRSDQLQSICLGLAQNIFGLILTENDADDDDFKGYFQGRENTRVITATLRTNIMKSLCHRMNTVI